MKLTNGIIFNSVQALNKLKSTNLPVKTSYKINKIFKVVAENLKSIEESRNAILKKYGNEENGQYFISMEDKENLVKFYTEFNEILSIEEEYTFHKITLEELENAQLTPDELSSVEWMIEDEVC